MNNPRVCSDIGGVCEPDYCRCGQEENSELDKMFNNPIQQIDALVESANKIKNDFKIMFAPEEDEEDEKEVDGVKIKDEAELEVND